MYVMSHTVMPDSRCSILLCGTMHTSKYIPFILLPEDVHIVLNKYAIYPGNKSCGYVMLLAIEWSFIQASTLACSY